MKSLHRFYMVLFFALILCACTEEIVEPTGTCTFSEITGNTMNPYTDLYQQILDDYAAMWIPGISIAIETPEHGWWVGCAGMACIEDAEVLESCHLFHSASLAKTYTATMIMRLVEDGRIDLDDSISEYLPEEMIDRIANGDVATIRHCLSHTAGFWDGFWSLAARTAVLNNPQTDLSLESRMENYFYGNPAIAAPGEKFRYSRAGFDMLGMIIEKASDMTIGEYFDQEISLPLGLVNTYYKASPGYPEIDGLVNGYIEHYPGKLQNCSDLDSRVSGTSMGSSGVIATPYEYARFYHELIRGNILDPTTLEVMLAQQIEVVENVFYCLGIYRESKEHGVFFTHKGMLYGILGQATYFPDSDVTYSIMTNLGGVFGSGNIDRIESMRDEIVNVIFTGSRE